MLAPTERLSDADVEARGQRPADAEAKGPRSEVQRGLESESESPRPAGSGPELEVELMRKSHNIFDSF